MNHRPASSRNVLFSVLIASILLVDSGPAGPVPLQTLDPPYVPGQVLLKFESGVPLAFRVATLVRNDSRAVGRIDALDIYTVEIPSGASVEETAAAFARTPGVAFAEPNFFCRAAATPNDNLFKYQYALSNTGQTIGDVPGSPQGKVDADIKATQGWEEAKGDDSVVIAILDSGIDMTHPDLIGKFVGAGKDFINDDLDATDDFFHGTAVAGIAAANTNNNEGIAGVAWNAKLLPVKVLDAAGIGTAEQVADAIRWAAEQGAQVINLSFGFQEASQTLLAAVQYAFNRGCVLVASVGNGGGPVEYPAAYVDYVLGVAATDYTDAVSPTSNTGTEVDVAAPGVEVLSTVPTWYLGASALPYSRVSGTSMAAPHVSGLAALLLSQKPWLNPDEIMQIIRYSADDVNIGTYPGKDIYLGFGRINMEKALVPRKLIRKDQ